MSEPVIYKFKFIGRYPIDINLTLLDVFLPMIWPSDILAMFDLFFDELGRVYGNVTTFTFTLDDLSYINPDTMGYNFLTSNWLNPLAWYADDFAALLATLPDADFERL